mgnify:CR=1 FL=1
MLGKRMEDAAKANRVQIVTAANPSRVDPAAAPPPPPSAALPYDPDSDTPSNFAEGPRETKTVLHSIDKLRALRGNP